MIHTPGLKENQNLKMSGMRGRKLNAALALISSSTHRRGNEVFLNTPPPKKNYILINTQRVRLSVQNTTYWKKYNVFWDYEFKKTYNTRQKNRDAHYIIRHNGIDCYMIISNVIGIMIKPGWYIKDDKSYMNMFLTVQNQYRTVVLSWSFIYCY